MTAVTYQHCHAQMADAWTGRNCSGELKRLVETVLKAELGPGGGGAGGREAGADMEVEGVLEALDVVLAPRVEVLHK